MIITDTLSNLLSSIKNGYLSNKYIIVQQKSKLNINVLNIFLKEGLIKSYQILPKNKKIKIYLKQNKYKILLINNIKKFSTPGKRLYIKNKDLYLKKKGLYILSTSKGIMTELEAKKLNIGGELICQIF